MPFEPLVTATIETALNHLINDAPEYQQKVARLKGKVIRVHLQDINRQFIFIFSHRVDVLSQYEGDVDCYLSVSFKVIPQLKEQANITHLIKQDQLVLEGDIQLAQKFSALLSDIAPEPEEWLSRLTGDVVAHTLVQGAKTHKQWLEQCLENKKKKLSTVVTEEWRCAPSALEVASFCDQVDDVVSQYSRLEQKLNQLVSRV